MDSAVVSVKLVSVDVVIPTSINKLPAFQCVVQEHTLTHHAEFVQPVVQIVSRACRLLSVLLVLQDST